MPLTESIWTAAIGVLGALVGTGGVLVGGALVYRRERELRRIERLRSLYADVTRAAMWLVPFEFGFRLAEDIPPTTEKQIDTLTARLRLETWWDGDHVFEELKELYPAVAAWNEQKLAGASINDFSNGARNNVIRQIDRLEDEMRKNLGIPTPILIPRRPRH